MKSERHFRWREVPLLRFRGAIQRCDIIHLDRRQSNNAVSRSVIRVTALLYPLALVTKSLRLRKLPELSQPSFVPF